MPEDSITELTTTVLRKSKGRQLADGDRLLVNYQGTLLSGEQFDASFDFSSFEAEAGRRPFEFVLGAGQVIQGWDQGLNGQKLGEVVELKIPSELAYGEQAIGDSIPPNSSLIFTVEVLAMLPAGEAVPIYLDFKDIGIKPKKIGLTDELLATVQFSKTGLNLNDELNGGEEADLLIGLKGKDTLDGGLGADVLIGGKGKDRFLYSGVEDSLADADGRDHILDFGKKDKINLQALAEELQYIKKRQFTGTAGEVRFKKETLSIDIDGDESADFAVAMPGVEKLKGSNLLL
ncbi:FKBP-type peptidyl-prolyl cis-trans isomerase [Synechococcus sp. A15-28]|uniref:FKBP-type peptidyl-prolyl cis-trans isomerase n=1 Tax=Synechococcus sp. A15-28 TaxID=1050638 RepID=UPI0016442DA5|nr:FKBP-type peptidyl-prolyl cis-trans isomerase [Synechococcus sp. A15-28]QNI42828.1 peptidyl-prolyl cis-trans isomerase/ FKBP-type/serralysin-like metalloprotease [Synechococcus sp. A15-28]